MKTAKTTTPTAPDLSIIIPCYNAELYLAKCLDSILSQSYTSFEVICIDDCSSDKTVSILKQFTKKDPRLKIIVNNKNQGVSIARNQGIEHSKGQYLLFCDPDDYYSPGAFERFVTALKSSKADIVCTEIEVIYHAHSEMQISDEAYYSLKYSGLQKVTPELIETLDLSTNNKIFRRSLIKKYNLTFPPHLRFEDAYFTVAYLCLCRNAYFLPEHLYNYVRHEKSAMSDTWTNANSNVNAIDHFYVTCKLYDFLQEQQLFSTYSQLFWRLLYQFTWFSIAHCGKSSLRREIYQKLRAFLCEHELEFAKADPATRHKLRRLASHLHRPNLSKLKLALLKFPPIRWLKSHLSSHSRSQHA